MDRFNFFLTFYSLILGLSITEILGRLGKFVRADALRKIDLKTAFLPCSFSSLYAPLGLMHGSLFSL